MSVSGRPEQARLTSPRSDRVRMVASLSGRSARRRTGLTRVEGPQAVRSLLTHRPRDVQELFLTERCATDHPDLLDAAHAGEVLVRCVDEDVARALVRSVGPAGEGEVVGPQGAVATARVHLPTPLDALSSLPRESPALVVILDAVQDPGNTGTLIRSADAAGADMVILGTGGADPLSPKAVRASAGSIFHLPVATGADITTLQDDLRRAGVAVAATSGYGAQDLFETPLPNRLAWIFGNEGRGVDPHVLERADLRVAIPLAGSAESLNVQAAATVCLFETLRRRRTETARAALSSSARY